MMSSLAEIHVSLIVRRTVSSHDEVFRLAYGGDIDGLKLLFSKGLASPNDLVAPHGGSMLQVSKYLLINHVLSYVREPGRVYVGPRIFVVTRSEV